MRARATLVTLVVVLSAAGLAAQSPFVGQWHGRWTGDNYAYSAEVDLVAVSGTVFNGTIHWTMAVTPNAEDKPKVGVTAVEYVSGEVDPTSGELHLKGYQKEDPQSIIDLDEYKLKVDGGDVIRGTTSDHNTWAGQLRLRRVRVQKDTGSLSGTYTLYDLDDPTGAPKGEIKIAQDGDTLLITGDGWRAAGKIHDGTGYYDWTFTDGRIGRTEIKRNDDGTINGLVHGSGLNWTYLAVATQ
jgi:hypothetical protein